MPNPASFFLLLNHVNAFRKNVKAFQSSPMMWLDFRQTTASLAQAREVRAIRASVSAQRLLVLVSSCS